MKLGKRSARHGRLIFGALIAAVVGAVVFSSKPASAIHYPDPIFPVPLAEMLPFPWDSIEGVWVGQLENKKVVKYSFEVLSGTDGRKFLSVIELASAKDEVVARGNGFVDTRTNMIRAAMSNGQGAPHLIFVGVYVNEVDPRYPRQMTMLTLRNFSDQAEQFSVMIEKVVEKPYKLPPL